MSILNRISEPGESHEKQRGEQLSSVWQDEKARDDDIHGAQCGADWIADEVAERIEALVEDARKNRLQVEVMSLA